MQKFRLDLDALAVQSFDTTPTEDVTKGTVHARNDNTGPSDCTCRLNRDCTYYSICSCESVCVFTECGEISNCGTCDTQCGSCGETDCGTCAVSVCFTCESACATCNPFSCWTCSCNSCYCG